MPSTLAVARTALVAVALFAAVLATAYALYAFWPAGVALGLAVGVGAVLAIGARMQLADRAQPADTDLAARLGVDLYEAPAPRTPERRTAKPERTAKPVEPEPADERIEPVPAVRPAQAATPERIRRAARLLAGRAVPQPVPVVEPAPHPVADDLLEAAPVLHAQPDILYFTSDDDPDATEARVVVADPVRSDLEHLKAALGDDYRDFARAARLVVSTQYASAARLQRELDLPYSRARRLLADLEQQHFVGPATGSLPRQVLMPKDRLPEVERLLAEA